MKVLLVAHGLSGLKQAQPDIGLGFLAARLREGNHEVWLRDFSITPFSELEFRRYLTQHQFGLVGFKVFSCSLPFVKQLSEVVRSVLPKATVVCGGPHPSCAPEHSLAYFSETDYICVGEGEQCVEQLARQLESGSLDPSTVPGLGYRSNAGYKVTPSPVEDDLTRFGMPAWDLIRPEDYIGHQSLNVLSRGKVIAPISISRGCPYLCGFCTCHTILGRRTRYRPVDLVLDEIQLLVEEHGVDEIQIIDDYFTRDRAYVLAFCNGLAKRGLNIRWACPFGIRIDSIEEETVVAMNRSGCYMVSLGIESGTERILDLMNKRLTPEETEEKVRLLREKTDMLLQGFFILGYPTETREEMEATIALASRLPLDLASFTTLRLTPGAGVLDLVREEGWTDFAWEGIDTLHVQYHPKTVTARELARIRARAYWRFYASPRRMGLILRHLTSWRNMKHLVLVAIQRLLPSPQLDSQ